MKLDVRCEMRDVRREESDGADGADGSDDERGTERARFLAALGMTGGDEEG